MATSSERINNMFANSSTWRSKEEEQKGRAAIHASQVNRYSAANARAFAGSTVSQEDLEKEREASQKRKAAEASELAELLEAQKTESAKGQKLAFAKVDKEKKEKKMPVLVKKQSQRQLQMVGLAWHILTQSRRVKRMKKLMNSVFSKDNMF
ncbi:unnamed protein product [Durusdinium trenchii]|uniref:Uncharacterized protein n=1 Tax=Durusdinium trenchii TaxID=1381693 RepID=A0ABP0QW70_9DINO